ncbi:MAG: Asp-tRNA(Asn)/Glu-tRNA(Gln) amidotransferase subunit GatA [Candidatus Desulfofervidus auxilii]|nr:Asp-tRNA(Asn)/Glu-tRNA(Gln) amidotransferase subunit GatA [Candidatus Desulfofervidus auxilii]
MLAEKSISELHNLLKKKEIRPCEIVEDIFKRIEQVENKVKAYITLTHELALKQAEEAEKKILSGEITILTGIPLAIKDNICTVGIKTTCASKILADFIPPYDATVIKWLKEAGAIIIGKTNMDEFAMGSSTENSAMHLTYNPWDLERVPGGSSGGSAAAVAADECIGALGSDTGGSIRQPASFCGVVGLKPTYGLVSRFGLVAFASSLDQIGPLAKNVTDAAILLSIIAGHDEYDSTSAPIERKDYTKDIKKEIKGFRLGVIKEAMEVGGLDTSVKEVFEKSIKVFSELGTEIKEVSLPHLEYAVAVYYIIAPAEASSNLARYDGVKYGFREKSAKNLFEMYCETRAQGFGAEVKRRIMLGTYALSAGYYEAYYKKASQVRTLIKKDFEKAFEECDFLLMPVAPTPAFRIGEKINDPLQMYLSDIFTIPINLAGLAAISVPAGFSNEGLPIGLQIIGPHFSENRLLQTAYQFEKAISLKRKPPL